MDITLLQLEKEDIILLTKVIGGLSSLIIIILGWYIHRQTEKIKVMENLITEKKNEAYSSFVGLFYDLLAQSKENKSFDTHDGLIKMLEIKKTLFMYGSDKVFKAMNEWLKYCNPQYDQKEMLNKVLELLVLIRKDLQNKSKTEGRRYIDEYYAIRRRVKEIQIIEIDTFNSINVLQRIH